MAEGKMGRREDPDETKAAKKKATQEFICAVENGGTKNGPKLIEKDLGIGDKSGSVWCKYRRGERSWPFTSLLQKIERAKFCGYISEMMARELISKLPSDEQAKSIEHTSEPYAFDAALMFFLDVKLTVEQLVKQIHELRNRISHENEQLQNVHYHTTSLDLLEPIKTLIQDVLQEKLAEELRLRSKFGIDIYKDIAPSSSPKRTSACDVGYTPDWWMKSHSSAAETVDIRNQAMNDKVKKQRATFIARFGNDGVE